MNSKIKTLKKVIANKLVDNGLFSKQGGKRLVILMYHGIDQVQNTIYNQRFFSVANFEQQVAAFKKHFNILTYADFVNENYATGKTNVLLTFDDGYANNFKYALPVLEKYDAHAVFFITGLATVTPKVLWADALDIVSHHGAEGEKVTLDGRDFLLKDKCFINKESGEPLEAYIRQSSKSGYAEKEQLAGQLLGIHDFTKSKELDDYWQLMTDEQIAKTAMSRNITIGSHGFYHNNLGSLSNEDAVKEAVMSKKYLEQVTQKEVSSIGFPDGSYTPLLNESLYSEGFMKQLLVTYRYDDDNNLDYTYDRFGLYPGMGNGHRLVYKILAT